MKASDVIKEYRNRFASVEKLRSGCFELYNDVTGQYCGTTKNWSEASAFMQDTKHYYSAIERGTA